MSSNRQQNPNDWFISDIHFGHERVLEYCRRPFANIKDHDNHLMATWNAFVAPHDRVYVVGDFSFHRHETTRAILYQLNGQKFLVRGNHDYSRDVHKVKDQWAQVAEYKEVMVSGHRVCLHHYPMLMWRESHLGAYHLHGHSHGSCRYPDSLLKARILDVGVDNLFKITGQYRPISWDEVLNHLDGRGHHSMDHHVTKPPKVGQFTDWYDPVR